MIKKIVEADNEAKAMESEALQEKEKLNREIEAEAQKIYDRYMNEALKTAEHNEQLEVKKAEQQLSDIKQRQKSAFIKLKSDYELNCDKWVNAIVSRVTQ